MVDELDIFRIADSHLVLHLLAPDEADIPQSEDAQTADTEPAEPAAPANPTQDFLPENLVQDFLDEASDMFDDVEDVYAEASGWEKPLIFGFVDGVLAVSNDTWSALEDSYYENMSDPAFADIDAAIDRLTAEFEGERCWDEAAKGHVRAEVARLETDPATLDAAFWAVYAHGFMFGADAAYDLEWKVIVTPANNVMLTDEDAVNEATLARLQAESGANGSSLFDRVLNMIGIDPNELAAALGLDDDEDEDDDDEEEEEAGVSAEEREDEDESEQR